MKPRFYHPTTFTDKEIEDALNEVRTERAFFLEDADPKDDPEGTKAIDRHYHILLTSLTRWKHDRKLARNA